MLGPIEMSRRDAGDLPEPNLVDRNRRTALRPGASSLPSAALRSRLLRRSW